MAMLLLEQELDVSAVPRHHGMLTHLREAWVRLAPEGLIPIRFVVTSTTASAYQCEFAAVSGLAEPRDTPISSIFEFRHRLTERSQQFNVVLLVPTGVGAEIGGHAGDAGPVAKLLGATCDRLILHPNVVNASDINEMPPNALYVEGSVICRLLIGTAELQPVQANHLLV